GRVEVLEVRDRVVTHGLRGAVGGAEEVGVNDPTRADRRTIRVVSATLAATRTRPPWTSRSLTPVTSLTLAGIHHLGTPIRAAGATATRSRATPHADRTDGEDGRRPA